MFFKIGVFENVHWKTPVLESLFNKFAVLKDCKFIKKRLQHRCFPVNIFKNSYFEEHLRTAASSLNRFFRTTTFWRSFYNSLSNMFISSSYFTFVSVHISLNIFITCRDCIYVHCDKEINSRKFRILLMYVFSFTVPLLIKESTKNPPY